MKRNLLSNLFGLVLVALLVTVPLAVGALAASDASGDPHAGHDMSTMNQSDMSTTNQADPNTGHDMNNMNQAEGETSDQHANSSGASAGHGSGSGNSHDSSNSGGHGEGEVNVNTPPNWPVIYGFGAFNLLVIIAAALLKNKGIQRNEVN